MTTFYAQPYNISVTGFYFTSAQEFESKADKLRNRFGEPVEEFEIHFIDGEAIDFELARALGIHQVDVGAFIEAAEVWGEHEKRVLIIAAGECGYTVDLKDADPDSFDIDIYEGLTMRDLEIQFVDEGLFGVNSYLHRL